MGGLELKTVRQTGLLRLALVSKYLFVCGEINLTFFGNLCDWDIQGHDQELAGNKSMHDTTYLRVMRY